MFMSRDMQRSDGRAPDGAIEVSPDGLVALPFKGSLDRSPHSRVVPMTPQQPPSRCGPDHPGGILGQGDQESFATLIAGEISQDDGCIASQALAPRSLER